MSKNKSHVHVFNGNGNGTIRRRYVSIADAAVYIGCNPATIRAMLADGRLSPYRLGPRILRIDLNQVDAAMEQGGVA